MKSSTASIFVVTVLAIFAVAQSAALAASQSGKFKSLSRYSVKGTATVSQANGKTTIKLSGDFKSSSGPDLYIYVGNGSPTKRIAKLKRNSGAQTYTFSGTAPISSVHVYCKRFSVGFGTAKLN